MIMRIKPKTIGNVLRRNMAAHILGDPGAVSRVDKMFVVKVD